MCVQFGAPAHRSSFQLPKLAVFELGVSDYSFAPNDAYSSTESFLRVAEMDVWVDQELHRGEFPDQRLKT
jgi:hypothetical protein